MLIAFFLSPFVIHHLGTSAYGVWVLVLSFTGYLGLLDLGVRGTATFYVAKFHTQNKHEEASRVLSSALAIFSFLGMLAIVISIAAAPFASRLLHIPENLKGDFRILLIVTGAAIASTLIGGVFGSVVAGLQRFELVNAIEIVTGLVRASVIVFCLRQGKGLLALAAIQLVNSLVMAFMYFLTSSVLYPQLKIRYALFDWTNARLIFSFGSYLFLLNVSMHLILNADSIVIGAFLPVAMVAFFAIASNLITYSRQLINGISFTISPLTSSLDAKGNFEKIRLIALSGPRYMTMLILPVVITFALRGKTFIGLWVGDEYASLSGTVLRILSIALFFSAANQVATSMAIGINRHRPVVVVSVLEALLNLTLSIVLIHTLGIFGVAWGTALPSLLISLFFWPAYIHKLFGVGYTEYLWSAWGRPVISAIPFALTTLLVDRIWSARTVWFFFLQVALTLPVALLVFWFGCLSPLERHDWVARMRSRAVSTEPVKSAGSNAT